MITLLPYIVLTMLSGVAMHFGLLTLDQAQMFSLGCFFTAVVVEIKLWRVALQFHKELADLEKENNHGD